MAISVSNAPNRDLKPQMLNCEGKVDASGAFSYTAGVLWHLGLGDWGFGLAASTLV